MKIFQKKVFGELHTWQTQKNDTKIELDHKSETTPETTTTSSTATEGVKLHESVEIITDSPNPSPTEKVEEKVEKVEQEAEKDEKLYTVRSKDRADIIENDKN